MNEGLELLNALVFTGKSDMTVRSDQVWGVAFESRSPGRIAPGKTMEWKAEFTTSGGESLINVTVHMDLPIKRA